ncbi:hypothetical protein ACYPKM_02860 [Pseudomonas aeruginosa]
MNYTTAKAVRTLWTLFMVAVVAPSIFVAAQFQGLSFTAEGYGAATSVLYNLFPDSVAMHLPFVLMQIWAVPVFLVASCLPENMIHVVYAFSILSTDLAPLLAVILLSLVSPPFLSNKVMLQKRLEAEAHAAA